MLSIMFFYDYYLSYLSGVPADKLISPLEIKIDHLIKYQSISHPLPDLIEGEFTPALVSTLGSRVVL